ncbi:MAG: hypothetical protein ACRD36_13205, partial [Candidatus Acidiferrum sp.]
MARLASPRIEQEMVMFALRIVVVCALVALLAPVSIALGQADSQNKSTREDKEVVDSKATIVKPAASVDFRKQLGLPYNSLRTLGTRIDAARREHDPVGLANAANELSVAEKVAGKQADLNAKQVVKEAAELAKIRRQESELRAVLKVTEQVANEENSVSNLHDQINLAKQITADDI